MRFCTAFLAISVLMLGLLLPSPALAAGEFKVRGLTLPAGAVRLSEDRYRLSDDFNSALKWYRRIYTRDRYPLKQIVNQPGIKAVHIENPDPKSEWQGFNLYEISGEVRIYVLAR